MNLFYNKRPYSSNQNHQYNFNSQINNQNLNHHHNNPNYYFSANNNPHQNFEKLSENFENLKILQQQQEKLIFLRNSQKFKNPVGQVRTGIAQPVLSQTLAQPVPVQTQNLFSNMVPNSYPLENFYPPSSYVQQMQQIALSLPPPVNPSLHNSVSNPTDGQPIIPHQTQNPSIHPNNRPSNLSQHHTSNNSNNNSNNNFAPTGDKFETQSRESTLHKTNGSRGSSSGYDSFEYSQNKHKLNTLNTNFNSLSPNSGSSTGCSLGSNANYVEMKIVPKPKLLPKPNLVNRPQVSTMNHNVKTSSPVNPQNLHILNTFDSTSTIPNSSLERQQILENFVVESLV